MKKLKKKQKTKVELHTKLDRNEREEIIFILENNQYKASKRNKDKEV